MKQKILIEVAMTDSKSRKKALKIAVGRSGVTSVTLQGDTMNKIEVIGEGVDAVELTSRLRKKLGHADILNLSAVSDKSVERKPGEWKPIEWKPEQRKPVEWKPEEKKPEVKKVAEPLMNTNLVNWQPPYNNGVPHYQINQVPNYQDPSCTIM